MVANSTRKHNKGNIDLQLQYAEEIDTCQISLFSQNINFTLYRQQRIHFSNMKTRQLL